MTLPKSTGINHAGVPPAVLGRSGIVTRAATSVGARARLAYPILLLLFAFMGPYSLHPAAATGDDSAVGASAAAAASGVEEGTRTRQVAVILLAGFAALTLSAARRRRREVIEESPTMWGSTGYGGVGAAGFGYVSSSVIRMRRMAGLDAEPVVGNRLLLLLLVAYAGLASVSVMWAGDPLLAAKRAVVFLVLAFTAYALAHTWSLRELLYFSLFASASSLILGIGGAVARGDFQPFAPDYRFVGFGNPNLHGIEAACLVIAAAVALGITKSRRLLLAALLVFGLGMLLLTKSRTALAALIMAGLISAPLVMRRRRLLALAILAVAVVFAVVVFVPETLTHVQNAALLGRSAETDNPATLSGRTLLWSDLLYFAADRPLLGYGFDSFWTPAHIAEISVRRGWVITQSHSGYIEALLNVGWIGAGLLVFVLVGGLIVAIRRFRRTRVVAALFAVAMLAWYIVNMLAEAIPEAHFSTLIIMTILAHLALRTAAPDDSDGVTLARP